MRKLSLPSGLLLQGEHVGGAVQLARDLLRLENLALRRQSRRAEGRLLLLRGPFLETCPIGA